MANIDISSKLGKEKQTINTNGPACQAGPFFCKHIFPIDKTKICVIVLIT